MGILTKLISRNKRNEIEELFRHIREESKLFEEYLKEHEKKIGLVKQIMPKWKKGDIQSIEAIISEILSKNERLLYLLNKILQIQTMEKEREEKVLFHFIVKEKMNQTLDQDILRRLRLLADRDAYPKYAYKLHPYLQQIFDLLRSLSRLILLQTKTIEKWGEAAAAKLTKDLIERRFFYHLLLDEAELDRKLKQNLIIIIRIINQYLGFYKEYGFQLKKVKIEDKRKIIAKGIIFHELRDGESINFNKFHELYSQSFPPDETEDEEDLKKYINYIELKVSIKEGDNRAHLVVGMVEGEVIALTYFSTTFIKERKICFGHGWWAAADPIYKRGIVLTKLYERVFLIMQRDAKEYGVDNVDFVLMDIADPKKLKPAQLQAFKDKYKTNPFENLRFHRSLGFQPFKFQQLTPALKGRKPIDYELYMIYPIRKEWKGMSGVPLNDMLSIYYYDVLYGYDRDPKKDKIYRLVVGNIIRSAVEKNFKGRKIKIVPFGWD